MKRLACFAAFLAFAVSPCQSIDLSSVLVTPTRALLLAPPKLVVGQNVTSTSISLDGRWLVAFRSILSTAPIQFGKPAPDPEGAELVIWDSATGQIKTLPLPRRSVLGYSIQWFVNSNRAIIQFARKLDPEELRPNAPNKQFLQESFVLDASVTKLTPLGKLHSLDDWNEALYVSPRQPIAVKVVWTLSPDYSVTLRTIRPDASLGPEVRLPGKYDVGQESWSQDGRELLLSLNKFPTSAGKLTPVVLHFNPESGEYYESSATAPFQEERTKDVWLEFKLTTMADDEERIKSWWMKSSGDPDHSSVMVVPDSPNTILGSGERFVAYTVDGALFVRQILQLTKEQFEDLLKAEAIRKLISRGKQVGLAVVMYSGDNDDKLPSKGGFFSDILPYTKDTALAEGFVYVYQGTRTTDSNNPAEDVMGYFNGPGGKVVVYMDSHVKWVPDK